MKKTLIIIGVIGGVSSLAYFGYQWGWFGAHISIEKVDKVAKIIEGKINGESFTYNYGERLMPISRVLKNGFDISADDKQIVISKGYKMIKTLPLNVY